MNLLEARCGACGALLVRDYEYSVGPHLGAVVIVCEACTLEEEGYSEMYEEVFDERSK